MAAWKRALKQAQADMDEDDAQGQLESQRASQKAEGRHSHLQDQTDDEEKQGGLQLQNSLAKLMRSFSVAVKGDHGDADYSTVEDMQRAIWDSSHHAGKDSLLLMSDIITVDGVEEPPPRLTRFTSRFARWAARVFLLAVGSSLALAPLIFIFDGTWADPTNVPGQRTTLVLDLCCDIIFAAYLLLQLNMSFLHPNRRVEVTSRRKILIFRLGRPLFWVQIISATSYIWYTSINASLLFNLVKCVRFVHLVFLPDPLWLSRESRSFRLFLPAATIFALAHWVACILVYFGGYREALDSNGPDEFQLHFLNHTLAGYNSAYFMALVESAYMITGSTDNVLGSGWVRDHNLGALIIVLAGGILGIIVSSAFIATIVREQALRFTLEIRHQESKAFVKRALQTLNIPSHLQKRVFSLHYFQKMSHDHQAFKVLFEQSNLSQPLEDAIKVYLYRSIVFSPFFKSKDSRYILAVVRVLHDRIFLPGDYVARRGEVANEMFFVNHGEVTVLVAGRSPDGSLSDLICDAIVIPGRKRKGAYFGEVALIKGTLRTAWIRADTYVVLCALSRKNIDEIWKYFPQERDVVVQNITQTVTRDAIKAAKKLGQRKGPALAAVVRGSLASGLTSHHSSASGTETELPLRGMLALGKLGKLATAAKKRVAERSDMDREQLQLEAIARQAQQEADQLAQEEPKAEERPPPKDQAGSDQGLAKVLERIEAGQRGLQHQVQELLARQVALEELVLRALPVHQPAASVVEEVLVEGQLQGLEGRGAWMGYDGSPVVKKKKVKGMKKRLERAGTSDVTSTISTAISDGTSLVSVGFQSDVHLGGFDYAEQRLGTLSTALGGDMVYQHLGSPSSYQGVNTHSPSAGRISPRTEPVDIELPSRQSEGLFGCFAVPPRPPSPGHDGGSTGSPSQHHEAPAYR